MLSTSCFAIGLTTSLRKVFTFALLALTFQVLADESYPTRAVKFVIPFPPGGGIDVLVRALGKELSIKWRQPVIIENKAGAATFVGAESVARAPNDGYTLLATTDPTFTSNRHLFAKLPYDPDKSFEPVIQMVKGDNIIFVHPTVPANDLKELVGMMRRKDVRLSFGSYGNGTQPHLVFGYLNKRENLDMLHVPYKGIAPVMTAVLAKEVDLSLASAGVAGEMIKSGRLRPIAITGARRHSMFPNVPTSQEQGFGYLRSFIWYGLFAPAGTPESIVTKINRDIASVLKESDFAEKQIFSKGLAVMAGSPREFAEIIREDSALVGEMVKAAEVKPE